MWEEEAEVKEEEKERKRQCWQWWNLFHQGNRKGKSCAFNFHFPKYDAGMCFPEDQYSAQVEYGTNLNSSLSWRKYM